MIICNFCKKVCVNALSFTRHSVRCPQNPNRLYGKLGTPSPKKGKTKETDLSLWLASVKMKKHFKEGTLKPKGCCSENYFGSNQHLTGCRKGGGYRENAGHSKKYRVYDSFGKLTTLQSSFELNCSEILAELGINWIRPKAIKYDGRKYFADFYLPDYDIWLDPKNDYKAKLDEEKIRKVQEQNGIKLFVLLEHQITKSYIARLAETD